MILYFCPFLFKGKEKIVSEKRGQRENYWHPHSIGFNVSPLYRCVKGENRKWVYPIARCPKTAHLTPREKQLILQHWTPNWTLSGKGKSARANTRKYERKEEAKERERERARAKLADRSCLVPILLSLEEEEKNISLKGSREL